MTSIRALVVPRHGDASVLTVEDRELAPPGAGEVQVSVAAAGVNFIDIYQREGVYPVPTPFVLGMEGAGTITAVGPDVQGMAGGDRVAWAFALGSAATAVNVNAASVAPVPDGIGLDTAAAAMLQGMTAHYLTHSTYVVREGDTVLVHAAAGGVGQLLVQMCTRLGARVIATAGSSAKLDIARRLGADELVDYSAVTDLAGEVRRLTDGRGVEVVYDGVGASTFDASLASLRPRGMLVLFGGASGQVPPFDVQRLNAAGSVYLTRPNLAHYLATREELLWRASDLLGAVADGGLELSVGGRYPLTDAAAAYSDLAGRRSTGKLLLVP